MVSVAVAVGVGSVAGGLVVGGGSIVVGTVGVGVGITDGFTLGAIVIVGLGRLLGRTVGVTAFDFLGTTGRGLALVDLIFGWMVTGR